MAPTRLRLRHTSVPTVSPLFLQSAQILPTRRVRLLSLNEKPEVRSGDSPASWLFFSKTVLFSNSFVFPHKFYFKINLCNSPQVSFWNFDWNWIEPVDQFGEELTSLQHGTPSPWSRSVCPFGALVSFAGALWLSARRSCTGAVRLTPTHFTCEQSYMAPHLVISVFTRASPG